MVGTLWEWFWGQVDQYGPDECWPWRGPVNNHGYGHLRTVPGGRKEYAHRARFVLAVSALAPGVHVLHHCDNPPCCNPNHLHPGNPMLNSLEKRARGRSNRGERHGRSKLTDSAVRGIRHLSATTSLTQAEIARRYSVSQSRVSSIVSRHTWGHVE